MALVGIIIPTWNNPEYLIPCLNSIIAYTMPEDMFHVYVVNNGSPESVKDIKNDHITILQQSKNLGWEGGLKAGLEVSKEPFVMFMNDDTYIPSHQRLWIHNMLNHFVYPDCAAVGPSSNVVMGRQNIFIPLRESGYRVKFLIGFCMLLRRDLLDQAGGVDDTLPGGDDLDVSIRLRNIGKYLIADRETFVYHHGFKTGTRVKGAEWNSANMIERTNHALIEKHGLRSFLDLWSEEPTPMLEWAGNDKEGDLVRKYVNGKVLELGCGDQKTVPDSVGIDIVPHDCLIPGLHNRHSVADFVGDVSKPLPVEKASFDTVIARHVLEHMVDPIETLRNWSEVLKMEGKLIIAVPDHDKRNTIPMNYQHVHAWTKTSLPKFMESLGWKTEKIEDCENHVSFIGVFKRNGFH